MNLKLIIFLLFIVQSIYSQNGFVNIQKAKKCFKENKIKQSLTQLGYAENSDYGFCGNAWKEAEWEVKYLKSQIYNKQGLYDKALTQLDLISGCSFGGDCQKSDSLKVVTLINKFGKEKVSNLFKTQKTYVRYINDESGVTCIRINEINYNFYFTFNFEFLDDKINFKDATKLDLPFCELIKKYNFYKLIE